MERRDLRHRHSAIEDRHPLAGMVGAGLTPFINALVLRTCGSQWLDQMRVDYLASRRPLFTTHDGKPVVYNYVSDASRREIGPGEHITQTELHIFLGIKRAQAGTDLAMASCGQVSQQVAVA